MISEELRNKIQDLQIRLNSCDIYAKGSCCDELLEMIRDSKNLDLKAELCGIVAPHLVDLERYSDVNQCVDMMMKHKDYHFHLNALWVHAQMSKKRNDIDGQLAAFHKGVQIALDKKDDIAVSQGYMLRGKVLLQREQLDAALEDFNRLIPIAEKHNDYNLVAISLYYIALSLQKMGHDELCLQKLREASELAYKQRNPNIIMQTEVFRARMQMKLGENEVAERILDSWCNEFEMML